MVILQKPKISKQFQSLLNELNQINLTHSQFQELKKKENEISSKTSQIQSFTTLLKSEIEVNPRASTNNKDEETILDYAEHFRQQYMYLYRMRQSLLLTCKNEANFEKFVSTTIRPSLVEQDALFDWKSCAEFVSDAIVPKMLETCTELPKSLVSPIEVLRRQEGHCFEVATLLCSLLLGAGYDAFIVSGYATRELCLGDETRNECDLVHQSNENLGKLNYIWDEQFGKIIPSKTRYGVRPSKDLSSKFDKQMANKSVIKAQQETEKDLKLRLEEQAKLEAPEADDLYGVRVHGWVMVRSGRREIPTTFFIDPFSGKCFSQDSKEFLGVESIYNHKNYYVCMQDCLQGCVDLKWDVNDSIYWEPLLPHKNEEIITKNFDLDDIEDDEDFEDESNSKLVKAIKMPDSWVSEIVISFEMYETRCPYGKRSFYFKRAKLEKFAPYLRVDGMTQELSLYEKLDYHIKIQNSTALQVQEWFENRADMLLFRNHDKRNDWITECFKKGRLHWALRRHKFNLLTPQPTAPRIFYYYNEARSDGLFSREIQKSNMIEKYINRADRLTFRQTIYESDYDEIKKTLRPADGGFSNHRKIMQIKEQFKASDIKLVPGSEPEISEIVYYIEEEKIHIRYHRSLDKISPCIREFDKPKLSNGPGSDTALAGTGSIPVWNENQCHCYSNEISTDSSFNNKHAGNSKDEDFNDDKPSHRELFQQMKDLMISENNSIKIIRQSEEEISECLTERAKDERTHQLLVSIYDTKRNVKAMERRQELERLAKEDAERRNDQSMDYLAPFLAIVGFDSNDPDLKNKIDKETAERLKKKCLSDMKQRLVASANVIQARFDIETRELEKRQQLYNRKQMHSSKIDEEEYFNYCQDATFKIHILEKRLAEHRKQAPVKWTQLEQKIQTDVRLGALRR